MKYESLAKLIEPYINGPASAMPDELRQCVADAFVSMLHWDELKSSGRMSLAQQHDIKHDPAMAAENQHWFDLYCKIDDCQRKITEWELMHPKSITEAEIQETKLATLNAELSALNLQCTVPFGASHTPAQATGTPAPGVAASDGPAPLTTSQIAGCFAGFHDWDAVKWKDNLQSPAPWLKNCLHRAGNQGKPIVESTWWPVQIAVELDKKHPNIRRNLHARFKNQEPLKPWLEAIETNLPDDSET